MDATNRSHESDPFLSARTGDVFFMNRKCWAMKDPLGIGLCLLTKTENRFDHVGMLVKISKDDMEKFPEARKRIVETSPSDTYVLETNIKGITLYSAEQRVSRSSAHELAARTVELGPQGTPAHILDSSNTASEEGERLNHKMLRILEGMYDSPYQDDVSAILPSIFSPPDKMDRVEAAYKINQLNLEVAALEKTLASLEQADPGCSGTAQQQISADARCYEALAEAYSQAAADLRQIYFPHLARRSSDGGIMWDRGHFSVDGVNHSSKLVCTELIGNLWLKAGITNGYVPASSLRPFDFLDDTRFNFTSGEMRLGDLVPFKVSDKYRRYWLKARGASTAPVQAPEDPRSLNDPHVAFYNRMFCLDGTGLRTPVQSIAEVAFPPEQRAVVPVRWVVQSNDQSCIRDLGARLFGVGVLFSFWAVPCAPLTLQWVEGQVGLFLIRGSVWSLTCGLLARNLAFASVQGATAFVLGRLLAPRPSSSEGLLSDVMSPYGAQTQSSSVSSEGGGSPMTQAAPGLVDWRHPFYTVAGIFGVSSAVAHVATQPIVNGVLAQHFGPQRAGPLPRKLLMRGAFLLAPCSVLLPMQGYFLSWYETAGSCIIPVRSSVFRPRSDLLERPDWPHFRNDALCGAFAAMLALDLLVYPFHTHVCRRLVKELYHPQASPSIGRRFYPAYRYRFAGNVVVSAMTCATLHFLFNLI